MRINGCACGSEMTVLLGEYFKCHVKCGNQTQGGGFLNIVFLSSAATCCFCLTFLLSIPPSFYVYISLAVCLCAASSIEIKWVDHMNLNDIPITLCSLCCASNTEKEPTERVNNTVSSVPPTKSLALHTKVIYSSPVLLHFIVWTKWYGKTLRRRQNNALEVLIKTICVHVNQFQERNQFQTAPQSNKCWHIC